MTNECSAQPVRFKIGRLEGEQAQDMIQKLSNGCRPLRLPGPDSGRNKMDKLASVAPVAQGFSYTQREIRRIYA